MSKVHYRIYFLDAHGHVLSAKDAFCDDDTEALETARAEFQLGDRCEVWRGYVPVWFVDSGEARPVIGAHTRPSDDPEPSSDSEL